MRVTMCGVLCCVAALATLIVGRLQADQPKADKPTVAEFQKRINEYGKRWTMTDGAIDLTKLDEFYAPDENVIIFDIAPPGVSMTWVAHRKGLDKELFSTLKAHKLVPRQDVTLRLVGDTAAVTTFTFDYAIERKDGEKLKGTGRQSNVWERRGGGWVIVHEHSSPPPQATDK